MVILIDHSVQSVEKYSVQEIHTKNIILAIDVYLVSVRHIYLEEKSRKVVDLLCSLKHLFINKKMLCKKKKVRKAHIRFYFSNFFFLHNIFLLINKCFKLHNRSTTFLLFSSKYICLTETKYTSIARIMFFV